MSSNTRTREVEGINLDIEVNNQSGDAATLGAHSEPVDEVQSYEDYAYFYHGWEGTEGKQEYRIANEGIDLELLAVGISMSEGAEDNRVWLQCGRAPQGNPALFRERFLSNFGPNGSGSSWSRSTAIFNFRRDRGVPEYFPTSDEIYLEGDLSNPNNTDTTKVYMQAWFAPWGQDNSDLGEGAVI